MDILIRGLDVCRDLGLFDAPDEDDDEEPGDGEAPDVGVDPLTVLEGQTATVVGHATHPDTTFLTFTWT